MQRVIFSLNMAFILMFPFTGCLKKGDGDPFLSLRTRKARLTGEWKVKSVSINYSYFVSYFTTIKIDFSGNTLVVTTFSYDINFDTVYYGEYAREYEEKWKFEKNDTFILSVVSPVSSEPHLFKGAWGFTQNTYNATKNKEQLSFKWYSPYETNFAYFQQSPLFYFLHDVTWLESYFVYDLFRLKNKEMILKRNSFNEQGVGNWKYQYNANIVLIKE